MRSTASKPPLDRCRIEGHPHRYASLFPAGVSQMEPKAVRTGLARLQKIVCAATFIALFIEKYLVCARRCAHRFGTVDA